MEIDRLAGKGKKGKGKDKGKESKGKGKQGKDSKGKGKQGKDKGHDKSKPGDKRVRVGSLRFREKFLIGGVTCPLLSLGKLYKAGFYVIPSTSGDSDFILTNGEVSEPVRLKRQSLCATGSVRVLAAQPPAVRAVSATLHGPLLRLDASGWQRIGSRCYALLSFGPNYVDSTLVPLTELL
eukprot:s6205_g5.t1